MWRPPRTKATRVVASGAARPRELLFGFKRRRLHSLTCAALVKSRARPDRCPYQNITSFKMRKIWSFFLSLSLSLSQKIRRKIIHASFLFLGIQTPTTKSFRQMPAKNNSTFRHFTRTQFQFNIITAARGKQPFRAQHSQEIWVWHCAVIQAFPRRLGYTRRLYSGVYFSFFFSLKIKNISLRGGRGWCPRPRCNGASSEARFKLKARLSFSRSKLWNWVLSS